MIVRIDKSLEKDVKKIKDPAVKLLLAQVIREIQNAERISEIQNLKKLHGKSGFYRIRIGDYRLGLVIRAKEIELIRLLHRKDIYKYFP